MAKFYVVEMKDGKMRDKCDFSNEADAREAMQAYQKAGAKGCTYAIRESVSKAPRKPAEGK
jgi:hypothetical protein